MGLGTDSTICTDELRAALRAVSGTAVDSDAVRPTVAALGGALYQILTVRGDVEATSETAAWIAAVQAWAAGMETWRATVVAAVNAWAPTAAADVALRQAILSAPAPTAPPTQAPTPPLAEVR